MNNEIQDMAFTMCNNPIQKDCQTCGMSRHCAPTRLATALQKENYRKAEIVEKETVAKILAILRTYHGPLYGKNFFQGAYIGDLDDLVEAIANKYNVE